MVIRDPQQEAWRELAECRNVPPHLFFEVAEVDIRRAKTYCKACEVRVQCLEHALTNNEEHGVWGGLSEKERHNLRQRVALRRTLR